MSAIITPQKNFSISWRKFLWLSKKTYCGSGICGGHQRDKNVSTFDGGAPPLLSEKIFLSLFRNSTCEKKNLHAQKIFSAWRRINFPWKFSDGVIYSARQAVRCVGFLSTREGVMSWTNSIGWCSRSAWSRPSWRCSCSWATRTKKPLATRLPTDPKFYPLIGRESTCYHRLPATNFVFLTKKIYHTRAKLSNAICLENFLTVWYIRRGRQFDVSASSRQEMGWCHGQKRLGYARA